MYFSTDEYSTDDGYSKEEYHNEVIDIAIQAVQEKLERENPKPLGMNELNKLLGKPVWVTSKKMIGGYWGIIENITERPEKIFWITHGLSAEDYGKTWLAYKHKPIKSSD